jgi:hypothetical protein
MLPAQRTIGCHLCLRGTARIEETIDIGMAPGNRGLSYECNRLRPASRCEGQAREDWFEAEREIREA